MKKTLFRIDPESVFLIDEVYKVKEYTNGRVDFVARWLGCALACVAGLVHGYTQQSDAAAGCASWNSSLAAGLHQPGGGCTVTITEQGCYLAPATDSRGNACGGVGAKCYQGSFREKETCTSGYTDNNYFGQENIFNFTTFSTCAVGTVAGVHYNPNSPPPGTMCKSGCVYAANGNETDVRVDPGALATGYKMYTSTGATCFGQPDTSWPDGHICNVDTGVCIDYNPSNGHGTFCDSSGNCRDVPESNGGGCSSSSGDAVCGAPGGGAGAGDGGGDGGGSNPSPGPGPQNPSGPTPQPPSPPFLPNSQPIANWTVTIHTAGSGGSSDTTSNESQHQCGGAGQEPCSNGPPACPAGEVWSGAGYCYSPTPQCSSGSHWDGSSCVGNGNPTCPAGQSYQYGVGCTGGAPVTCPANTTLVNGQCIGSPSCPSGTSWDGAECRGKEPPACPAGQVADSDGVCHPGNCPVGWTVQNGMCVQNPPTCPTGQTEVNGVCVDSCPDGQTKVNGTCQQIASNDCNGGTVSGSGSTAICTCPTGQTLINGTCATHSEVACVNGTVINAACVCPSNLTLIAPGVCGYGTPSNGGGSPGGGGGPAPGGGGTGGGTTGGNNNNGCDAGPQCSDSADGGGTCDGPPPSCTGDSVSCNALFQAWLTRCVFEKEKGTGPSDDTLNAATKDPGSSDKTIDGTSFDSSGSGLPMDAACALVPDTVVLGVTLHFESVWCDLFSWIGQLVEILAYLVAARICARG